MEPLVPNKKLEPGVFQGNPNAERDALAAPKPPRLIRTMKLDMAEAVKNQHETTVSIAIAEEKKKTAAAAEAKAKAPAEQTPATPAPKPHGRFVVVLVILILIAALGAAYVFLLPKLTTIHFQFPKISLPALPSFSKKAPVSPVIQTAPLFSPSIISAQSETSHDITTEASSIIAFGVGQEEGSGIELGAIKNIHFTESAVSSTTQISAARFLSFAGAQAPDILTRSLDNEFMAGILGQGSAPAIPFIILKVSDYNLGLAGMLQWEPSISRTFDALMGTAYGKDSSVKFHSDIIGGKDARILAFPFGGTIAYAFADQSTVVIAGSRVALETLLPLATKK